MAQMPGNAVVAVTSGWDGGYADDLRIAESLEGFGWKGSFFVPADQLGNPGRLEAGDLRALVEAGNEVGLLITDPGAAVEHLRALNAALPAAAVSAAVQHGTLLDPEVRMALREHGIRSIRADRTGTIRALAVEEWLDLPYTASVLGEHMELRGHWEDVEQGSDGLFYLVGTSTACTGDEEDWATLECNLAFFCGHGHVWYCTQGEFAAHFSGQV